MAKKDFNVRLAILSSAIKALEYKQKRPNADIEEIMKALFLPIKASVQEKKGMVVGISKAVKYSEGHPSMSLKEIVGKIMKDVDEIIVSLDEE